MAYIGAAKAPAGSIVATDKIAYIKTGDGDAPWKGTDGKTRDNTYVERQLNFPHEAVMLRLGVDS